jgi:ANTAR domain
VLTSVAASHPGLAVLLDRQIQRGSGPVLDAVRTGMATSCPDTLAAPERRGVRWSTTAVHTADGLAMTLTLYGARRTALDPDFLTLASLLARVTGAALASAAQYDGTRRAVTQLEEAITARSAVDQAKGMLMEALGCDADEALSWLCQLSQTRHVILSGAGRRSGRPVPAGTGCTRRRRPQDQLRGRNVASPGARGG